MKPGERNHIELTLTDEQLVRPVLERVISSAAAQAALPVDRVIDALSIVDTLCDALDRVLPAGAERRFVINVEPDRVELSTLGLTDLQVIAVEEASVIPALGAVFERLATVGRREHGGQSQLLLELT